MIFNVKCLHCLWDAFIDPAKLCSLLVPTSRLSDGLAFFEAFALFCFSEVWEGGVLNPLDIKG